MDILKVVVAAAVLAVFFVAREDVNPRQPFEMPANSSSNRMDAAQREAAVIIDSAGSGRVGGVVLVP